MAQVFDKTKRQKDKKTTRQDLQILLRVYLQECVKKSHFFDSMAQVSFSINLLLEVSSVSGHVTDRISEPVDTWI